MTPLLQYAHMYDYAHSTTGANISHLRLPLQLGTEADHRPASIQSHTLKDVYMGENCLKHCKIFVLRDSSRDRSIGQLLLTHTYSGCIHRIGDKNPHPVTKRSALQSW